MGLRRNFDGGGDASRSRKTATEKVLGRDKPIAGALREARLYRPATQMLHVSRARVLPPGRSDRAPLIPRKGLGAGLSYGSFDLLPAICARVSPLKRKLVQSSIGFAPICL